MRPILGRFPDHLGGTAVRCGRGERSNFILGRQRTSRARPPDGRPDRCQGSRTNRQWLVFVSPVYAGRPSTQGCTVEFTPGSAKPTLLLSPPQLTYAQHGGAAVVAPTVARERAIDAYLQGQPFDAGKLLTITSRVGLPTPVRSGATLSELTETDMQNIDARRAVPFYEAVFVRSTATTVEESGSSRRSPSMLETVEPY